jgi:hypothetical protein
MTEGVPEGVVVGTDEGAVRYWYTLTLALQQYHHTVSRVQYHISIHKERLFDPRMFGITILRRSIVSRRGE